MRFDRFELGIADLGQAEHVLYFSLSQIAHGDRLGLGGLVCNDFREFCFVDLRVFVLFHELCNLAHNMSVAPGGHGVLCWCAE